MRAVLCLADAIPDPTSVGWWLQNFGPIGLVVFAAGTGLWKLAKFLKPYFIELATGHVALMDSLAKTQTAQCNELGLIATTQASHSQKLDEIHRHTVPHRQ